MLLHFRWNGDGGARCRRRPYVAHVKGNTANRQDFPNESITDNSSVTACLHLAASGVLARSASSARSIALSTVCQSAAARGFKPASASSHWVSRSLIRILAPARSPLSINVETSTTMVRNGVRSPSFDDIAASASATNEICPLACRRGSLVDTVSTPTANAKMVRFMRNLLVFRPHAIAWASGGRLDWRSPRRIGLARALAFKAHPGDERDDDGEKREAGVDRAEAGAAVASGLRKQVTERCAKGARQDVGQPKGENRIGAEIVGESDGSDQNGEYDDADLETEAESFGREITCRCSQRKGEEDRRPVEKLTPPGDNGVN